MARKRKPRKNDDVKYWTVNDLATRLGVTRQAVHKWVAAGHIEVVQVVPNGKILILQKEVERILNSSKRAANDG